MYGTNQELYTKHTYGSSLLWVWGMGMGTNIKWVMISTLLQIPVPISHLQIWSISYEYKIFQCGNDLNSSLILL